MNDDSQSISSQGEKVFLREMQEDDANFIVKWRNDPQIRKWMFNQKEVTIESHLKWFRRRENRIDYMICESVSGSPIGTVNFIHIQGNTAEAGKMIGEKEYWGGGYAKEAFSIWLNLGFKKYGFYRIRVKTMIDNFPNIHLNEKLGFKRIEVIEKEVARDNREKAEVLVMEINKGEFLLG